MPIGRKPETKEGIKDRSLAFIGKSEEFDRFAMETNSALVFVAATKQAAGRTFVVPEIGMNPEADEKR